jgi:hypothetical protein
MARFARKHERAFLTVVLTAVVAVAAAVAVAAWRDGDAAVRWAVAAAWLVPLLAVAGAQVRLYRRDRLILRAPGERSANRVAVLAARDATLAGRPPPVHLLTLALSLALGIAVGEPQAVVMSAFGGAVLGFAPVMLYIAFVVRPDQQDPDRPLVW